MMHIVVLQGGWSQEREISLMSGAAIASALERLGYRVTTLDMTHDVAQDLARLKPDLVYNALHGSPGEDGTVQGMMDLMGIRYTHSSLKTSAMAMDKNLTKIILTAAGIRMPSGKLIASEELFNADPLPRPYVIKPVAEGSSVGVVIVSDDSDYGKPVLKKSKGPWAEYDFLLAEEYIPGRELTVAVLNGRPLVVTELKPSKGFYDYDAKYTEGLTNHILPAKIPKDVANHAMLIAEAAHAILGCSGVSRSDFRYDESRAGVEGLFLLEVNTQPGMTQLSLVPEQAAWCGFDFDSLIQQIVEAALNPDIETACDPS